MGLVWRKSLRLGRRSRVNLGRSGASVSRRVGPVTLNSRRRMSFRLPFGFSHRSKF